LAPGKPKGAKANMDGDDIRAADQHEPGGNTDQQAFDDRIAQGTGKFLLIVGGVGILAALVMSTIALINSGGGNSTTTVTAPAKPAAGQTTGGQSAPLTGDALGKKLFVSGNPSVGVVACGSCHTMKAAGTNATVGPNLDKVLTADPASATLEATVDPNKELASGYSANVMPTNYGSALTKQQLDALVNFVYQSTNTKAKRSSTTTSTAP
jgi:mono/diheme cytochrome c family protein